MFIPDLPLRIQSPKLEIFELMVLSLKIVFMSQNCGWEIFIVAKKQGLSTYH